MFGFYKHYKGGWYFVLGKAVDSTNSSREGVVQVVYFSLKKLRLHTREKWQFEERVPWPDRRSRPRFIPLKEVP